jgi:hypothetical protein
LLKLHILLGKDVQESMGKRIKTKAVLYPGENIEPLAFATQQRAFNGGATFR